MKTTSMPSFSPVSGSTDPLENDQRLINQSLVIFTLKNRKNGQKNQSF
jgi:hypothetical protein